MILYTSDLHFGHSNVIRFDHRPFADRDEMDHVLIELWNGRVQPDDTVYIVGDFCYRSDHAPEWYLRQLKGHKWARPQYSRMRLYSNKVFQVVGHTPVRSPLLEGNLLTLDTFSTYRDGSPYGDQRFVWIDTVKKTWEYVEK